MTRKQQRLGLVTAGMIALGGAVALVLSAFSGNLVFFYSPTQLAQKAVPPGQRVRIGGLVELHSIVRSDDGQHVVFRVTDGKTDIGVAYTGILPDLFREGQGVVAEGKLGRNGVFQASTILAKHDARYMPPEVVAELKKTGRWKEGLAAAAKPPKPSVFPTALRH